MQCLYGGGQTKGTRYVASGRRRHREPLNLVAGLDDIARHDGSTQALSVAVDRLLPLSADQCTVGEEVKGEVLDTRISCPLLKAGQVKASERGHIVTRIVCVSMTEAKERRRKARLAGACGLFGDDCRLPPGP
jgi:hypothetical protein